MLAPVVVARSRIAARVRELLADEPLVLFGYLYGSRALGYARPDSDIDVAVYMTPDAEIADDLSVQERLAAALGIPATVIRLDEPAASDFFQRVLPNARVVKDAPERLVWEKERGSMANEEAGTLEDYLRFVLDSMREKSALLREAIPLLDKIDLNQAKSGDLEAASTFIGRFFVIFQPFETIVRRMANYLHLTTGEPVPTQLKDQVRLLAVELGLTDEQIAPLIKITDVRNKVAHAYWNLTEQELSNNDLRAARTILGDLTQRIDEFVKAHNPAPEE
ncbi:MAG: nucleotidyltransferase domain-containing protein [Chloroflexi bacterium]|nr:nucleotidyltransferase domain-containing protein [Chloroflexota bacterium]